MVRTHGRVTSEYDIPPNPHNSLKGHIIVGGLAVLFMPGGFMSSVVEGESGPTGKRHRHGWYFLHTRRKASPRIYQCRR